MLSLYKKTKNYVLESLQLFILFVYGLFNNSIPHATLGHNNQYLHIPYRYGSSEYSLYVPFSVNKGFNMMGKKVMAVFEDREIDITQQLGVSYTSFPKELGADRFYSVNEDGDIEDFIV